MWGKYNWVTIKDTHLLQAFSNVISQYSWAADDRTSTCNFCVTSKRLVDMTQRSYVTRYDQMAVRESIIIYRTFIEKWIYNRFFENRTADKKWTQMSTIIGIRTDSHYFRSQMVIELQSDCLLGQLNRTWEISNSDATITLLPHDTVITLLSLFLYITCWYHAKITKLPSRNQHSLEILVFWYKTLPWNSNIITPTGLPYTLYRWGK